MTSGQARLTDHGFVGWPRHVPLPVQPVCLASRIAALQANVREGLCLVCECIAAELTDADIEVIDHPTDRPRR